jgi:hypothetical protein
MTHRGIHVDDRPTFTPEPGPAPMLHWLPIDRLVIDEAYQRPLGRNNWSAIEKIAANFQWSRFAPVLAAPIQGGLYAVIDGQHRTHAAAMCGITDVPAMVVQVGIEEQSRAFAWVNSQTVKVTLFHVYKAALAAKEDWAIRAEAAVAVGGCRLMVYHPSAANKQPGEIYSIALMRRLVEAGRDEALTAALAALRAVPALQRTVFYTDYVLTPWIGAVIQTECFDVPTLARALEGQNPYKIIDRAKEDSGRITAVHVAARQAFQRLIIDAIGKRP